MQVHFFVAVDDQAICIDSEQIFGGEVELHFIEAVGFEDGFGGDDILFFLWGFRADAHKLKVMSGWIGMGYIIRMGEMSAN